MFAELSRSTRGRPWRVTVGRPYPGSYGIARSYEEAREGLSMAERLNLGTSVVHAEQLLIYRVLLRDQPAIADLVRTVLGGLVRARGGAEPLLATLDAYFAAGSVTTEAARRLHLSVRAVTYRLDRTPHSGSPSTPPCSARSYWAGRRTISTDDRATLPGPGNVAATFSADGNSCLADTGRAS
jgi:sugar diacid utilization regulator